MEMALPPSRRAVPKGIVKGSYAKPLPRSTPEQFRAAGYSLATAAPLPARSG